MGRRFGARLIKTADLGPGGRYLLACHPHGVSSISGFLMFGTEAAGFSDVFPGGCSRRRASERICVLTQTAPACAEHRVPVMSGRLI